MRSIFRFSILWRLAGVSILLLSSTLAAAADRVDSVDRIDQVYPNAEAVEPLKVGSHVPSVTVRTIGGESVNLAKITRDTGALLVFYRGGW
jgi:hypothetical protein